MKKPFIILLLGILIIISGCSPFVLSTTDTISIVGDEPVHLRPAKPVPAPVYENCEPGSETDVEEILTLTNEERIQNDLSELSLSTTLNAIAQLRAADMAENDYFAHVSPTDETAFSLLQGYGILYFNASENIGKGEVSNERMVQTWMDSAEHRKSILSEAYHQLGVGIVKANDGTIYWVQIFTN